jgi:hypothetical protein
MAGMEHGEKPMPDSGASRFVLHLLSVARIACNVTVNLVDQAYVLRTSLRNPSLTNARPGNTVGHDRRNIEIAIAVLRPRGKTLQNFAK